MLRGAELCLLLQLPPEHAWDRSFRAHSMMDSVFKDLVNGWPLLEALDLRCQTLFLSIAFRLVGLACRQLRDLRLEFSAVHSFYRGFRLGASYFV